MLKGVPQEDRVLEIFTVEVRLMGWVCSLEEMPEFERFISGAGYEASGRSLARHRLEVVDGRSVLHECRVD